MSSILITGATGTFGNAFIRRLLKSSDYERVCIFSRDELKQQQMRVALNDDFRLRWFIGDVRDENRLERAFDGIDIVIHAAALKQIDTAEYNPKEAILTNIFGAMNVIDAAIYCGVKKVVALSSDKACAPVNLYGKSKAVMESLFCQANVYSSQTRFSCVRYGNVWGSRGSVIPLWEKQLAEVGRIQITNLAMTRFFMTIDEACLLVENALCNMVGGEIFVPKIRSMSIGDLAKAWLDLRNDIWPVELVGMRPGEKMHETLISQHEAYRTLQQDNCFVVLPVAKEWVSAEIWGDKMYPDDFYASNLTPLSVEEIREWLKQIQ